MGVDVPLLNEYKQTFLFKRIPQTVLGGLKLRLGYEAPAYAYANQVLLWIAPWLLGSVFTLILQLAYTDKQLEEFLFMYSCLYGVCITIFVIIIQTVTTVVHMKEKEKQHIGILKKKNMLAEEDEIEFESCCGPQTLEFVVPPKKFKINIVLHALLSGLICGAGFWYLLPYSVNQLYSDNYEATAVIFIFGWLTVCIAQYSLTSGAPPEPAIYRTMDVYELFPLTRPFYALACYSFHVANWYSSSFDFVNQVLHVVFVLLPLLWFSGLLPPIESLFLWLLEQYQVFLMGGSPSASNARLLIQVILSTATFLGCYNLNSCFSAAVLAAVSGYLLSCDLGGLGIQIFSLCQKSNTNRVGSASPSISAAHQNAPTGFLWNWCLTTVFYHSVMILLVGGEVVAIMYYSSSISSDVAKCLGYVIIGFCVLEKVCQEIQCVYSLCGFWRNYFYPTSVDIESTFKQEKKKLLVPGLIRRGIMNWAAPLAIVAFISLQVANKDVMSVSLTSGKAVLLGIFYVFGVVHAFRWTWQSTTHALLEVSAVHLAMVSLSNNQTVSDLGVPVLLLIASYARDRLNQIANKLFFFTALLITSWTDKKQRRSSTAPIIFLNLFFFPLVLAIIVGASAISAPLLPLFTLALFFIGYPRHSKFWPEPVGHSANICSDSLYYQQLTKELTFALRSSFANGSLGEPHVGSHYLLRFQDRMVWSSVLERGTAYCTLSIKGLELQETSCHTAEASRIDDQFVEAFEGRTRSKGFGCCSFNSYPLHCLTPRDAAYVRTYSDAKNVLTGVIDSPDGVSVTLSFFIKSLTWVLLHHINKLKKKEEMTRRAKEQEIAAMEKENRMSAKMDWKQNMAKENINSNKRRDKVSVVNTHSGVKEINHNVFTKSFPKKRNENKGLGEADSFALPPIPGNRTNLVHDSRPCSADSNSSRKVSLSSSLHSFTDSIWSDDFDAEKVKRTLSSGKSKQHKMTTIVTLTNKSPQVSKSPHSVLTMLPPLNPQKKSVITGDEFDGQSAKEETSDLSFGLPAVDVNMANTRTAVAFDMGDHITSLNGRKTAGMKSSRFPVSNNGNHIYKPVMNLAGSPDFKCPYSSHISVPVKWRELPIEPSQVSKHIAQFPISWYKHILSTLDWSMVNQDGARVASEVAGDDALTNCYSQLVMACYSAFDTPGRHQGASYLFKSYYGDVPWNAMMDWLSEDSELLNMVIKAFRYGFKLMLDQVLLGDISTNEELEECLRSYDNDWYIGKEGDADWGAALSVNCSNLFSLGHNNVQGTYTSRTLTLQEVPVLMGRLNPECVRGQWANLNLELLYMTNDDEERYSIQAQPAMLRNLTVQAADPPLGYPIYSSPPISVPTL